MSDTPPPPSPPPRRGIAAAATPAPGLHMLQGAVLLIAVLYFGRDLFIPVVLAVLLSFVLAPMVRGLHRLRVPRLAGVLLVVALGFALIFGVGLLMARQATLLAGNLPSYQATIERKLEGLRGVEALLNRMSGLVQEIGRGKEPPPEGPPGDMPRPAPPEASPLSRPAAPPGQPPVPVQIRDPDPTPIETLQHLAAPLLEPLATTGIVVILVIFILLYREDLRDRLIRLAGAQDLHRTMAAMDDAAYRLSRFFLAQTVLNSAYGVAVAAALWLIGVPGAVLWGIVAGLMRFVPFVGTFIAIAPPALLAVAVDPGWGMLVWVLVLLVTSEGLMGQVVEPLVFGHSTGLSPIAVIAAATFWTWLWGPLGLLLAVPLTVCLVVLGRHVERLEFLEVMLGDQPPLAPEELFYQRGLAGDADALTEQAELCLKGKPLPEYLDTVALPALRLAQEDAARGSLVEERVESLERSVLTLIEDLEDAEEGVPPEEEESPPPPPPPAWREPGAVLCLHGRGPFDPLVASMLGRVLERRGFGVQLGGAATPPATPPRLLCLCLLEGGGSTATARYLLRRARRRLPGVPALALAWAATPDGPLAAALRSEGQAAATPLLLASSLVEAVDLAQEAAAGDAAAPASAPGPVPASASAPTPEPEPPPIGAATAPA